MNDLDCTHRGLDERREILDGVARAAEDHDSKLPIGKILLELKISIPGHEDSETGGFSCFQELSILQPGP
ncbi:MAG TPA: hypothetical protein VFO58_21985 [Vicinamibacterales bacterium]|nr:hypothetical protein [Vicinamibacterales bacterium]